jgi:hypothetical protein
MSARTQRLAEMLAARARLDEQIQRLGGATPAPGAAVVRPTVPSFRVAEAREFAICLIWTGSTHAEVADALGLPVRTVDQLVSAPVSSATARTGRFRHNPRTRKEAA